MPTPVCSGEVEEARHEVAALAGDADATGRRVRRDDLGAQVGRRRHDALPVGAGEQDAELVGQRHELVLGRAGPPRPPRRSRREVRNAARMPLRGARAQQLEVGRWPACTRTRGRPRRRAGRRCRRPVGCRAPPRPAGWWRTPRPRSRRRGCCAAPRSRTCPGGSTRRRPPRPAGSNSARNCAVGRRAAAP